MYELLDQVPSFLLLIHEAELPHKVINLLDGLALHA